VEGRAANSRKAPGQAELLNMREFLLRGNVETHQVLNSVNAVAGQRPALPPQLGQADINRIAAAVVALLRTQAPS